MLETLTFFKSLNSQKWIPALWGKLKQIRAEREKELDEIKEITFIDPFELAELYVEPDCQEMNPADRRVEDEMVAKEPVMVKINQFFRQPATQAGRNQLFILSDAGMGKSALLAMIKLMHLTRFWPQDRDCVLKKLGPKTLEEIETIPNKRETILLLDSLDEDPSAYGRVNQRLEEILAVSQRFAKAIITCRTQFFPMLHTHPLELPGQICIGGYDCYSKYLSFFNDGKVYHYLSKRFPKRFFGLLSDQKKIEKAKVIIASMGSLRCRPMLLSYIDDLMESPRMHDGGGNIYHIYDALVDNWLRRELLKKKDLDHNDLYDACIILATWMQMRQKREVSEDEINRLIETISRKVKTITEIDMKGRSLLNRNSEGDYRFSHYSIQEFLVAKFVCEKPLFRPTEKIHSTGQMLQMIGGSGKPALDLSMLFDTENDHNSITQFGMTFVYVPPGLFSMGRPEGLPEHRSDETIHPVLLTQGFYMQTTPVTQAHWQAQMESNPSKFKGDDQRPVESVSWNDAQAFIQKLNQRSGGQMIFRLPTQAEWEYACRGGPQAPGDSIPEADLDRVAWYDKNSGNTTHPVARKAPNALGLYDMLGNVWEWCQDWYGEYSITLLIDPQGHETGTTGSCVA
ncbi:formylglycine-generating enzyme family protein, partial [Desulfosarcina cetonica]|uniref:formylglycine-generating enzyme family protein n=1 Tax=Desulfosarcina cetonica TaxID=90730 RepID=UPI000A80BD23